MLSHWPGIVRDHRLHNHVVAFRKRLMALGDAGEWVSECGEAAEEFPLFLLTSDPSLWVSSISSRSCWRDGYPLFRLWGQSDPIRVRLIAFNPSVRKRFPVWRGLWAIRWMIPWSLQRRGVNLRSELLRLHVLMLVWPVTKDASRDAWKPRFLRPACLMGTSTTRGGGWCRFSHTVTPF